MNRPFGRDPRFYIGDGLDDWQPVVPLLTPREEQMLLYGDGTAGPPFGLFDGHRQTANLPYTVTRQQRRAAARRAAKERRS